MDTQISRDDGGIDKLTQLILGTHDITDQEFLANVYFIIYIFSNLHFLMFVCLSATN